MKVRIIENDQDDDEGTLYNVLDIMYTYVMFDVYTPKNITKVFIHDKNYEKMLQTKESYFVTLYTNNDTYINLRKDFEFPVPSTIFIKGVIRFTTLSDESTVYGKELPLDHDIHLYTNLCKADNNYCLHILETNLYLIEEVNRHMIVQNILSGAVKFLSNLLKLEEDKKQLISHTKYNTYYFLDRAYYTTRIVKYLRYILIGLIIITVGILVYKKFFFNSNNVSSASKIP